MMNKSSTVDFYVKEFIVFSVLVLEPETGVSITEKGRKGDLSDPL